MAIRQGDFFPTMRLYVKSKRKPQAKLDFVIYMSLLFKKRSIEKFIFLCLKTYISEMLEFDPNDTVDECKLDSKVIMCSSPIIINSLTIFLLL